MARQADGGLLGWRPAARRIGIGPSLAAAVVVLALAWAAMSASLGNPEQPFDPQCESWDDAASAALSDLIRDRGGAAQARLGDALFRLRRARKHCRHGWTAFARLDYEAILRARCGGPLPRLPMTDAIP